MVKGICSICRGSCGIELLVEDNRIIEVKGDKDHPISRGYICPKGRALPEMVHSKERLSKPMKKDENGNWEEIQYEDAINLIAEKLKSLKGDFGAESLSVHTGEAGVGKEFPGYVRRFCQSYGTPNYSGAGSHCHLSKLMANTMTIGRLPSGDYRNSKCIVLWGFNPSKANPYMMMDINEGIRKGSKLIVIDPQETDLAKKADLHLKLRPGTDGGLALGFIHVIIKENLYNKDFVEEWTIGFEELAKLVEDYTPKKVEDITGVPAETIVEGARLFANNNPSNISPGIAVELLSNGFQTARAISILQGIMGNIDVVGGAMINPPIPLSSLELEVDYNKKPIGSEEFPLFYKTYDVAQANIISDAILEEKPYSIKAMMVIGSNPILTWPNANRLRESLKKLDFLVVMDNFMTETGRLADLIIPGSMFVERYEIWNKTGMSGEGIVGISPKIIESEHGIVELKFIKDIAKALGYEEEFPWDTEEDAMNYRFKNLGKTFEEILDMDYGYEYRSLKEKKYEESGFNTPSGKVEIYSETLRDLGYDPIPAHIQGDKDSDVTKEYPLILSTGFRYLEYHHSRYRDIKSLKEYRNEKGPVARIHPETGEKEGVKDDDVVKIHSTKGSIIMRVEITEEIPCGVIMAPHGWDHANVNELIDNKNLDPITGFPPARAMAVKIEKL